jgi:hypothetical protein
MVLKRIGPLSLAKIAGTFYAIVGVVIGAVLSLIALAGGVGADTAQGRALSAFVGAGSIVILPILYGCFGFVGALISAWLFNAMAGLVGGIEMDME